MRPPFSAEDFFGVFVAYNEAVWPAQVALVALGGAAVVLAMVRPGWHGKAIAWILAGLWIWMGVVYHWAFFLEINPAAGLFGALFVLEGVLLAWAGLRVEGLSFRPAPDMFGWIGGALIVYALIAYPLIAIAMGHTYPAQPTFGLPCPTTILTFGILLWAGPRVPWPLLIVPMLWAIVGSTAVRYFGVIEDAMLPIAGILAGALILWKNRTASETRGTASP